MEAEEQHKMGKTDLIHQVKWMSGQHRRKRPIFKTRICMVKLESKFFYRSRWVVSTTLLSRAFKQMINMLFLQLGPYTSTSTSHPSDTIHKMNKTRPAFTIFHCSSTSAILWVQMEGKDWNEANLDVFMLWGKSSLNYIYSNTSCPIVQGGHTGPMLPLGLYVLCKII